MIWREACLNLDIGAFTARVTGHLATTMPLRLLLVRRLKRDHPEIAAALGRGEYKSATSYGVGVCA